VFAGVGRRVPKGPIALRSSLKLVQGATIFHVWYVLSLSSLAYQCSHCWGTGFPYGLYIRRTGHDPPRGPSADWWVLTAVNAAGTNGLKCLPKHGRARDNKCLVTHLITDQSCLTSAIARRNALTAGPSSSSSTD
jgi:hypothetical protein